MRDRPARPEWQPIETAPHDGHRIIVWGEGTEPVIARWWDGNFQNMAGWWFNAQQVYPTHWMPLPDPPEVIR